MSETGEPRLGYHDRMANVADEFAISLLENGLEATLATAPGALEAADVQHNYLFVMSQAVNKLFETHDPAAQDKGLEFLAWEAAHFPKPEAGMGTAHAAKQFGMYAETRRQKEFTRRYYEVAVLHFQFTTLAEGYVPDAEFCENLGRATTYMEEGNFPELAPPVFKEFAPQVIAAATNYEPQSQDEDDYDEGKEYIDECLLGVFDALRRTNPALARQARALITSKSWLPLLESRGSDKPEEALFTGGDLSAIREFLNSRDFRRDPLEQLWQPLVSQLLEGNEDDEAYASHVLGLVRAADPEYLRSTQHYGMLSRTIGQVVGFAYQPDMVELCVGPELVPAQSYLKAGGIAYSLGIRSNQEDFEHLMSTVDHYSDGLKEIVRSNFYLGMQDSGDLES